MTKEKGRPCWVGRFVYPLVVGGIDSIGEVGSFIVGTHHINASFGHHQTRARRGLSPEMEVAVVLMPRGSTRGTVMHPIIDVTTVGNEWRQTMTSSRKSAFVTGHGSPQSVSPGRHRPHGAPGSTWRTDRRQPGRSAAVPE